MTYVNRTRDLFLSCMSIIYLTAFASLYQQIPGLYGDNGILPAKLVIEKDAGSWEDLMEGKPTLLMLTPKIGLTTQQGMELLCLVGMFVAFLCVVFQTMRDTVAFILLWMLYFSVYQVGQTFLWFQWDVLLLEAGFLTIIVAPLKIQMPIRRFRISHFHHHDNVTLWLVRWLLFRLMFASGVVKLTSKCPTWWGLTALTWHFESQCIPTPLAWYFHNLPAWFLKLSCVATYVIEIAIPFLFFAPVRSLRLFSFWAQVLIQVLIILTGNYNFFNFLTITLCIALLDDTFLGYRHPKKTSSITNIIATLVVLAYLGYETVNKFSLSLTPEFTIESKIAFSQNEFDKFLSVCVPWSIWIGAVSLAFEIISSFIRCFSDERGLFWKNWAAVQCAVFSAVAVCMFLISLVPLSTLHNDARKAVPKQAFQLHSKVSDFHLASSYGLFRRMTGVGGRPEVIIEGSNSRDGDWREYEFYYKPGHLQRRPPVVAPHQPRLDWQMWFAALGSYQHNPWFLNLAYRLLTNEADVLELVQYNPFPSKPPKYLRATLYTYHFTNTSGKSKSMSTWWTREYKGDYLPVITKEDQQFVDYLRNFGILDSKGKQTKKKAKSASIMSQIVEWIRASVGQPEGFVFVSSVLLSAFTIKFITASLFG